MRDDPREWLNSHDPRVKPQNNDAASRAARYPQYIEQIACTNLKLGEFFDALEDADLFRKMVILVHGDHGSRLNLDLPDTRLTKHPLSVSDFLDCYSTLLAVRWPGVQSTYDRRILPLGPTFAALILKGRVPEGIGWEGEQLVFFAQGRPRMAPRRMPDFGRSLRPYQPKQ
jgi:hypothetical protein